MHNVLIMHSTNIQCSNLKRNGCYWMGSQPIDGSNSWKPQLYVIISVLRVKKHTGTTKMLMFGAAAVQVVLSTTIYAVH